MGRPAGYVRWPLIGMHNVENGLAAIVCAAGLGVPPARSADALGRFTGVRRRLELRGEVRGIRIYDDFAHHPTAVAMTIDGVRRQPDRGRIVAVLEPRSNTMRLGVHRAELAESLAGADRVWLYQPAGIEWNLDGVAAELGAKAAVKRDIAGARRVARLGPPVRRPRADHEQWRIRQPARAAARGTPDAVRVNIEVRELAALSAQHRAVSRRAAAVADLRAALPRYGQPLPARAVRLRGRAPRRGRGSVVGDELRGDRDRGADRGFRPARGQSARHQLHRPRARARSSRPGARRTGSIAGVCSTSPRIRSCRFRPTRPG